MASDITQKIASGRLTVFYYDESHGPLHSGVLVDGVLAGYTSQPISVTRGRHSVTLDTTDAFEPPVETVDVNPVATVGFRRSM